MNKVAIIGFLGKDPELVDTKNGKKVCKFSISVKRNYSSANGENKYDFFNCVAWVKTGENIAKYCAKGSKIAIIGSLETNSYTDKNGNKRNEVVIVVGETEFLQTKPRNSDDSEQTQKEEYIDDYDSDSPF